MTDRIRHLTVILDRDMRDDDVECVLTALRMTRFVASVEPHVVTSSDVMARMVVRSEVHRECRDAIDAVFRKGAP